MKTLNDLIETIGIQNFNDMILTFISGDEQYIIDSLIEGGEITPSPDTYMEELCNAGFTTETFPWNEFREYAIKVLDHLATNLILPLDQEESPTEESQPKRKPRFYFLTNEVMGLGELDLWMTEELQSLQDDGNTIIDIEVKHNHGLYLGIIKYSY